MIDLTFDDGGLAVSLERAPQVTGLVMQRWLTDVLTHLHAAVLRNMGDGGLIGRRTGNLSRALKQLVTITPTGVIGELWPDPDQAPYAAIQEDGGVVTPKRGRALAIPLAAMKTANGVARATAGQVKANPGAYGFQATFIPKGHAVIMGRIAGRVAPIPLFALVQSVTIPARHYMATTLIQEWTWIADHLEQLTADAVNVAFGFGREASA